MIRHRTLVRSIAALALAGAPLAAMESFLVGPRHLGMGGTGVACADNGFAQYYNPATFGFFGYRQADDTHYRSDNNDLGRRRWGLGVDVTLGGRVNGEIGEYLDELSSAEDDIRRLGSTGLTSQQDVVDLIKVTNSLANIDDPGNAVTVDAVAGGTLRIGHFAIGGRGYMQLAGRVNQVDTQRLGIPGVAGGFAQDVNNTGTPQAGSLVLLQGLTIQDGIGGVGAGDAAELRLEFAAQQAGVTAAEAADLILLLQATDAAYGQGDFENNRTSVRATGFALGEIPVTYGHAFNEHIAIGGSAKLLIGRVYGTTVLVFNEDSQDLTQHRDHYATTMNVGLDLGVLARFPYINLGLTGRNLNAPTFDGPTAGGVRFDDVTLDPQVTAGISLLPLRTLTLSLDCDLLETETALKDYHTQYVMAGGEWNLLRFLALRGGVYKNLAEDEIDMVYTAGLGINLWAVRIDLAGALSPDTVTYDGDEIPEEGRASVSVISDF